MSFTLDRKVLLKFKGKLYNTPAKLYGAKCWVLKSQQENKLNIAKMRMLH